MVTVLATTAVRVTLGATVTPLAKILAASSLNNLAWFLLSSQLSIKLLVFVFSIYRVLLTSLTILIKLRGD